MKYTNYFGRHFKEHGQPHLSDDSYKVYFNLVCLENKIHGMLILKKKFKKESSPDYYQFDSEIKSIEQQIFRITTNQHPELFLMEMLRKSLRF